MGCLWHFHSPAESFAWLTIVFLLQLPRAKRDCPACNHDQAVFFQSQQRSAETGMVRSLMNQGRAFPAKLTLSETLLCLLRLR